MHVECLIHGNVNKQQALQLAKVVNQQMSNAKTLPLLSQQLLPKREYKLVHQESYRFITENAFHKSSCSELFLQCGTQNDTANVFIDLVAQVLSEPCYNTLRTKEQLGYIVFCGSRKGNQRNGHIIFFFFRVIWQINFYFRSKYSEWSTRDTVYRTID